MLTVDRVIEQLVTLRVGPAPHPAAYRECLQSLVALTRAQFARDFIEDMAAVECCLKNPH